MSASTLPAFGLRPNKKNTGEDWFAGLVRGEVHGPVLLTRVCSLNRMSSLTRLSSPTHARRTDLCREDRWGRIAHAKCGAAAAQNTERRAGGDAIHAEGPRISRRHEQQHTPAPLCPGAAIVTGLRSRRRVFAGSVPACEVSHPHYRGRCGCTEMLFLKVSYPRPHYSGHCGCT